LSRKPMQDEAGVNRCKKDERVNCPKCRRSVEEIPDQYCVGCDEYGGPKYRCGHCLIDFTIHERKMIN
jgi:predicted amidophosphoribosyltransferase